MSSGLVCAVIPNLSGSLDGGGRCMAAQEEGDRIEWTYIWLGDSAVVLDFCVVSVDIQCGAGGQNHCQKKKNFL